MKCNKILDDDLMVDFNTKKVINIDSRLLKIETWLNNPLLVNLLINDLLNSDQNSLSNLANLFLNSDNLNILNYSNSNKNCILILGSVLNQNGTPTKELLDRLEKAFETFSNNPEQFIIVSGGVEKNGTTEAAFMFNWLSSKGIPKENIIQECNSKDTVYNIKYSFDIINDLNIQNINLITCHSHIKRASYLLNCYSNKKNTPLNINPLPSGIDLIENSKKQSELFLLFKDLGRVLEIWDYKNYSNPIMKLKL